MNPMEIDMSEKNGPNPEDLSRVGGPEPVEWKIPHPDLKLGDGPTLNEVIGSQKNGPNPEDRRYVDITKPVEWKIPRPGLKRGDGPDNKLDAYRVSQIEPVNKDRTNILEAPHNLNLHGPDGIKRELEQYQKYAPVDAPAGKEVMVKFNNGATVYFKDGKVSRENGPAVVYANGDEVYAVGGKMHRKDGPAYFERSLSDGARAYYMQDGKLHNPNGTAILEWKHGVDPDKSPPYKETCFLGGVEVPYVLMSYMKAKTEAGKVRGMNITEPDHDGQKMKSPRM